MATWRLVCLLLSLGVNFWVKSSLKACGWEGHLWAEWELGQKLHSQPGKAGQDAPRIQEMKSYMNEQWIFVCLLSATWGLEILSLKTDKSGSFLRNTGWDG